MPGQATKGLIAANAGLLVMVLLWGSFYPLLERLLLTWDVYSATAVRQVLAAATLLALLTVQERGPPLLRGLPWGRLAVLGGIGIGVNALLTTFAIQYSSGLAVAIVSATNPISAAITARLLYGLPLARGIALGTALAVAGGLIAVFGGGGTLVGFRGGELLLVAANVLWTWYSIAAQHWLKGFSQIKITALTTVPGAVLLLAAVAFVGAVDPRSLRVDLAPVPLLLMLYAGVLPVAIGNFLWHFGVSRIGVTVAAMYNNLIPVAAGLVTLAFGVLPTPAQLLGAALILAGVFTAQLLALRARSAAAAAQAAV